MKVGDKVKVKSWDEILKTLNKNFCCRNLNKDSGCVYFNKKDMSSCVDLTGTISEIDEVTGNVLIKSKDWNCLYWWHPSWLELIPEELDVDKSCSSRWLIFCMIFQYLSGNCPNPSIFKYLSTPNKRDGGFNFSGFEYDFGNIQRGNVLFPDWPILNLPLDEAYTILEHCYKYGTFKKDLEFFTNDVNLIISAGFPWNITPEGGDYWGYQYEYYDGCISKEELRKLLTQTDIKHLETQIKTKNYETKLQRKKSIVIRGTVPEGSITCGRKRKTSIAVGYLSNSVCIGG